MSHSPRANRTPPKFPLFALLALAMTGFICIMTETLPAGLLPQIRGDMGISEALAGQMVTVYALGSMVAAIPLAVATRGWNRRAVLLATVVGFLIFNSVTALSTDYRLTLVARFLAGMAAGLGWSLLAGYARRMVPTDQQGKAMAIAMVGTPIALSLGVPVGAWLGSTVDWRIAFWIMSGLTVVLIVWILAAMPDYAGQKTTAKIPLGRVLMTPGVRPVLGVVIFWMLAHNILYTYIAPFVARAGLETRVDLILLVFGLSALIGIALTARVVDRHLRGTVLLSLGVFALVALVLGLAGQNKSVVYVAMAIWGVTFGGAATLLQTALADTAGEGADLALSMNVVAWNGAIAGGGILGGVLLDHWGAASFPYALFLLIAVAFLIAFSARGVGFPAGCRESTAL